MAVTASYTVKIDATQTEENAFGNSRDDRLVRLSQSLSDGTNANQADLMYVAERTVADGANDDIDLAGSLSDAFGATITAAEIVAIMVVNQQQDGTANTTDLTIGGAANAFEGFLGGTSPTIGPIKPGGVFFIGAGDAAGIGAVSGGSSDELRITNGSGAANTYQIGILARSA
jgi:hypothetical protein